MSLVNGINHVAIVTRDLASFIAFYTDVFGMELVFEEATPAFSHAILRAGDSAWLHPAAVAENAHGAALPDMFRRGHLDHLALLAPTRQAFAQLRERLVACGASSGVVEDLGPTHTLWFEDPDGMKGEVCLIVDPTLRGFHAPLPLELPAAPSAGLVGDGADA
jgi:catechol 2,3-dioxygenase-like lactoylglutathione lyase family enzyme